MDFVYKLNSCPLGLLTPSAGSYLYFEQVMGFDLLPEWRGERQQASLIHVEAAVLVSAHDVDGVGRAVPGRVSVRHHQLQDGAARRLALLQGNRDMVLEKLL